MKLFTIAAIAAVGLAGAACSKTSEADPADSAAAAANQEAAAARAAADASKVTSVPGVALDTAAPQQAQNTSGLSNGAAAGGPRNAAEAAKDVSARAWDPRLND